MQNLYENRPLFYKKKSLKVWCAEDSLLSLSPPVQHPHEQDQLSNGGPENITAGSPMPTTCFSIHFLALCQIHNTSTDTSALLSNIWIYNFFLKAPKIDFLIKHGVRSYICLAEWERKGWEGQVQKCFENTVVPGREKSYFYLMNRYFNVLDWSRNIPSSNTGLSNSEVKTHSYRVLDLCLVSLTHLHTRKFNYWAKGRIIIK